MRILVFLKQFFCKHEPYKFMALGETDMNARVCKKCGKSYSAAKGE